MNFRFLFFVFGAFFPFFSFASGFNVDSGKDSTTKLIDKTTALYLIEDGRRLLNEGKVREAISQFRLAATKDPKSYKPPYWTAMCHYSLSNFGFVLKYAKEALTINAEDIDDEVYFLMGKAHHRLGQVDSALTNYQKAMALLSPSRAHELSVGLHVEQCLYTKSLFDLGITSKRVHLEGGINTNFNEYAPILSHDGKTMYFTSRRNNTKGGLANPDDQEYFEDVYRAHWNDAEQKWDSITNEVDRVNSAGFDSFSHLSPDGLSALMTINTTATGAKKTTKGSDIFELAFTNRGKWSSPKRIANTTINTGFFEGSATMTADGNTMYFVSDRKGSKKMTDIYMATKVGKIWGNAVVLNDSVNTTGSETTPYITPDGKFLFFSSDGHLGMGGLDIFVSENLGTTWSKAVNLGAAINSVNNDTHFKYYPELKKAVMAGLEVIDQKASIDMYEVDMTDFEFPTSY
jgi:Tol biopolymer transport system component